MTSDSANKTVILITGANQGLGFECTKKLAAEQPNYHILLGSRDASKGQKAAASITKLAKDTAVEVLQIDVNSDDSIASAVKQVKSQFGRLDILFNNAGIGPPTDLSNPRAAWMNVFETNSVSAFCITEAFVPLLKKSEFPRVVFMSSILGSIAANLDTTSHFYGYESGAYGASKAALNWIAVQVAVKHKEDGFKVNMIEPGFSSTNLTGYNEHGGSPADGAIEACRIITQGKDGQYTTFTQTEGPIPW